MQVTVANASSSSDNTIYDTEMTSLNAALPNGMMIRDSQTEPSRGETEIDAQPDGTYQITSFFDIFTELSLDGGNTWSPATNGPVRVQLTPQAPEVPTTDAEAAADRPAVCQSGAMARVLCQRHHHHQCESQPSSPRPSRRLPRAGASTENFGSQVSGLISENGGASFLPFSAPANVAVQVNSQSDLDNGSTRYFDTEILQLNAVGRYVARRGHGA